ncbi:hypothetical protein N0575_27550 [Pseudomonas aeruginosa]|nr:hypothetical protein [Pseudomonas aeruginosa]MCT1213482.1 hypothetical protein [Pseudomonas aeruginosa]
MNKLILTIIALLISAMANAAYEARIPLEQSNGGSLPDNSIVFNVQIAEAPSVDKNQICTSQAINENAMYSFLGMGSLTSHSYANDICTMNFNVSNYSVNPSGTTCIENGDGTATFTETQTDGNSNFLIVRNKRFNGSCQS